jgi:hypothetical protein
MDGPYVFRRAHYDQRAPLIEFAVVSHVGRTVLTISVPHCRNLTGAVDRELQVLISVRPQSPARIYCLCGDKGLVLTVRLSTLRSAVSRKPTGLPAVVRMLSATA